MLVYEQKQEFVDWAAQQLGIKSFGPCTTIAIVDQELIAVAVFSSYVGHSVEFSLASTSPKWGSRKAINAFRNYAFGQLGCHRAWSLTRATNVLAQKQLLRCGFEYEGTLRRHYDDGADAMLFSVLRVTL